MSSITQLSSTLAGRSPTGGPERNDIMSNNIKVRDDEENKKRRETRDESAPLLLETPPSVQTYYN
jgi:hypothetical protein